MAISTKELLFYSMKGNILLDFILPSLSGYEIDFLSLNMIVIHHFIQQVFYLQSLRFMKTQYTVLELAEDLTLKKSRNSTRINNFIYTRAYMSGESTNFY